MKIYALFAFLGLVIFLSSCAKGRTELKGEVEYEHENDWSSNESNKTTVS